MDADSPTWTMTGCPECGAPAEVRPEGRVSSTDGPVELVRVQCVRRHWFLMDAARLRIPAAQLSATDERPAAP
jgi:hypothetical protein